MAGGESAVQSMENKLSRETRQRSFIVNSRLLLLRSIRSSIQFSRDSVYTLMTLRRN